VLLIDGGGREDAAVVGDIVGKALADLGCVGLVVDGAIRDVDGIDEVGLPAFARGAHPRHGLQQRARRDQRARPVRRGGGVTG
jgi:4-hydroxy-4-methyl-2-oxoglutarate aldolase